MILKEIRLADIDVVDSETVLEGSGKLIKVFVEFEDTDSLIKLELLTKEGEQILDITNQRKSDVFYPRANISRQRDTGEALNMENEGNFEPYYFYGGLFLRLKNLSSQSKKIKRLIILYENGFI